jgi:hypothetical protein
MRMGAERAVGDLDDVIERYHRALDAFMRDHEREDASSGLDP